MQAELMLAYDIGTSGVKTSIISSKGQVVDSQTEPYETRYAEGGIAEQDPLTWWHAICRTTRGIIERNPSFSNAIAAIGVSGHMLGCIPVSEDITPLLPCMIHSDARAVSQYETISREVGATYLYQMSGNILDARSSLSKIAWIKETQPTIYRKTAKFLQSKDFIVAKLTGNIDTTDYSDACHGELMDISKKQYDTTIYHQLKLDMSKLPALHRGRDIVGKVTSQSSKELGIPCGIPVIAGGGDGACGSAGAGNVRAGDAYLSLGSTAWIARVSDEPTIDPESRVFNIMNLDGETTSVFGTMQSAGSSITWAQRLLSISDLRTFDDMAAQIEPGCNGLVFLPYLDGERSPVFDTSAKGVFVGISQHHDARHFTRAVLEGVAYALKDITEILRRYQPMTEIRAIGGGMKSPLLPEIITDVCGLRLQKLTVPAADATSLGVAAIAGLAAGIFKDMQEALAHIRVKSILEPAEPNSRYSQNYQAYQQLYPQLNETMHLLGR